MFYLEYVKICRGGYLCFSTFIYFTFLLHSSSSKVLSLNLRNYPSSAPPEPQGTLAASLERAVSKVLSAAAAPDIPRATGNNSIVGVKKAKYRSNVEEEA
jgi:hypothetical protein